MADGRQVGDVVVRVGGLPNLVAPRNKIGQGPLATLVRAMERVEGEYGGKPPEGAWFAGLTVRRDDDRGQMLRWPSMTSARGVIGAFNRMAASKRKPWAAGLAEVGGVLQVVVVHTATPGVVTGRTEAKVQRVIGVSPDFAGVVVTPETEVGRPAAVAEAPKREAGVLPTERSEAEKAAELATTLRKLQGRGPVAGFDTGYGGGVRATVIRRGGLKESGGD